MCKSLLIMKITWSFHCSLKMIAQIIYLKSYISLEIINF